MSEVLLAEAIRVASRLSYHTTGWDLLRVLRDYPHNEEAVAALAVLSPVLLGEDRTRN